MQALGFSAQRLHALWLRLRGQQGSCWANLGQGAVLGRVEWEWWMQSEDLALDQVTAQGDKGMQGVWGCNTGWQPQAAVSLCSRSQGASSDLLGIPSGTAWWPGFLGGHLGPFVLSQPTLTLRPWLGTGAREEYPGMEILLRLGKDLGGVRRKESTPWGPAESHHHPSYLQALPLTPAPPLAHVRMLRPRRPPAGPLKPRGP